MPINHYENFPVASVLLPARLRKPVELIYRGLEIKDQTIDIIDTIVVSIRSILHCAL